VIVLAQNYILLERIELAADAASVTFSNIPQSGYTDLKVVTSLRGTVNLGSGYVDGILTFNGTTTGYSERMVYGLNGSAGSANQSSTGIKWGNWANDTSTTANTFANSETYISNYTSSNFKSVSVDGVQENNASGSAIATLNAALWSNTAAITSITLTAGSGSFATNSTFSIYGLAAVGTTPVIAPKATGGNIQTDGTYWYHTFLASGTFTPATALSCDYLAVAGGGGGSSGGGGGGAGGLFSTITATGGGGTLPSQLTLANGTAYTIAIGAGAAAVTGSYIKGLTGGNTTISGSGLSTITAYGGGGGGGAQDGEDARRGQPGGSGGGGGYNASAGQGAGGAATPAGQGFAGGSVVSTQGSGAFLYAAGGGGAGVAATNVITSSSNSTSGGNGVQLTAWANATGTGANSGYYAGGGGGGRAGSGTAMGGAGGSGGGGAGYQDQAINGTSNTGGGGGGNGGQSGSTTGGAGGSGIVIIRYLIA
jgi:hypothetical protein